MESDVSSRGKEKRARKFYFKSSQWNSEARFFRKQVKGLGNGDQESQRLF